MKIFLENSEFILTFNVKNVIMSIYHKVILNKKGNRKMNTMLNFDRVVLVKEMNEKFSKVGELFEVANILDNSFLLRDARTKTAIGVVAFEDFEKCFVHEPNYHGWTSWQRFNGFDGQSDCFYRTNRRKTQVKFVTDKVRAESCCCREDDFNLSFGLQIAYLRCLNKALSKKTTKYEEELKQIDIETKDNERIIKKMLDSLYV